MSSLEDKVVPKSTNKEIIEKANNMMSKVKTMLLLQQPFYGVLMTLTDFICDPSFRTLATDGTRIYYNPNFIISLSEPETFGALLHEINHCIYLHMSPKRRLNRERERWNVATDYEINIEINDMAMTDEWIKLPKGILLNNKFRNMNAEQIYDILPDDISKYSTFDDHLEPIDGSKGWDSMEDKIVTAYEGTRGFYEGARSQGRLPAGLQRWVKSIRKAKVPWERLFQRYIGEAIANDDFSYSRLNKRYLAHDMYLPSLRNYVIGRVILAVDTSGSITDKILERISSEMIKVSHLIEEIVIMTCDTSVHEIVKLYKMQSFLDKIEFKGKGGTSFIPVFEKIKEIKIMPDLLIYLTDTEGIFPDKAPPYPVLWCITEENGKVPWGASVYLPNDNAKYK